MRAAILGLLPLLLSACPPAPDGDDSAPGDSGDTGDTHEPPPVYPDGDRILLFHGHGGPEPDENGWGSFENIDAHWKDVYGWNADYRDYIPDDLADYRAILFLGPGISGEDPFPEGELTRLGAALEAGTRMVVVTERDGCAATTPNDLLAGLGSSLRLTGGGLQEFQIAEIDHITPHQITAGVSALRFRDVCWVDPGAGTELAHYQDDAVAAVDRPGAGGEVVLIGDFEFLDDSGPSAWADNAILADRLVEIEPEGEE
jgi:hypothetical protein